MDRLDRRGNKIDKKAVIVFSISLIFITILAISMRIAVFRVPSASAAGGSSMIVIEQKSGRILKSSNEHAKLPMASTTKVLTAITAIENADLNDIVKIDKRAVGVEGSSIYLQTGEQLYLRDLIYGLMLRSGNDSAEAIAYHVGKGDRAVFIDLMNKTAKKAGAENSNFVNPHGLHDENHYTTAYDLAKITAYAFESPDFVKIVGTKQIRVQNADTENVRLLINKNKMLGLIEGGNGVKTGFTKKAGRCLVSSAKRGEMQLICVVLNCPDMWGASVAGMEECFKTYQMLRLAQGNTEIRRVNIGKEGSVGLEIKEDIYYPIYYKDRHTFDFKLSISDSLTFPIEDGRVAGTLDVYCDNELIFSKKVFTINGSTAKEGETGAEQSDTWSVTVSGKTKQIYSGFGAGLKTRSR